MITSQGVDEKHHRRSARLHLLPPHRRLKVNPENVNSSAANSTTVSAPLELIYHQFPFHHAKLFLEAEIGPIPASTTFHYGQELNTWRPTLSSPPPYQVKTSFFLFPGKKDFLFFTANCLRAVAAQSPLS